MTIPEGSYMKMGVTPQIMARSITDRLARYLQQKMTNRAVKENWREYLLRRIAEYLRRPAARRPEAEKRSDGLSAWTVRSCDTPRCWLKIRLGRSEVTRL